MERSRSPTVVSYAISFDRWPRDWPPPFFECAGEPLSPHFRIVSRSGFLQRQALLSLKRLLMLPGTSSCVFPDYRGTTRNPCWQHVCLIYSQRRTCACMQYWWQRSVDDESGLGHQGCASPYELVCCTSVDPSAAAKNDQAMRLAKSADITLLMQ